MQKQDHVFGEVLVKMTPIWTQNDTHKLREWASAWKRTVITLSLTTNRKKLARRPYNLYCVGADVKQCSIKR